MCINDEGTVEHFPGRRRNRRPLPIGVAAFEEGGASLSGLGMSALEESVN